MLLDFWSRGSGRGVHPDDAAHLRENETLSWTADEAQAHAASFEKETALHKKLHVNLLPQPFIGNIRTSYVYILYGNPGFAPSDYKDELQNRAHQAACEQNLQGGGHGFFPLRAPSENTGVSNYWRPRLRSMAAELSVSLGISRREAAEIIIARVSLIEAGAYHSKSRPGQWADSLPSSNIARQFVLKELVPRARRRDVAIFVWRRVDYWSIAAEAKNVLIRHPSNARHSYLLSSEQTFLVKHLAWRAKNAQQVVPADGLSDARSAPR